jgi:hypothetical protein
MKVMVKSITEGLVVVATMAVLLCPAGQALAGCAWTGSCSNGNDCCWGDCQDWDHACGGSVCGSKVCCAPSGTLINNSEGYTVYQACCSGNAQTVSGGFVCTGLGYGDTCYNDAMCDSHSCSPEGGGTCQKAANGHICDTDVGCTSGRCVEGRCESATWCGGVGDPCVGDTDCCTGGYCNSAGNAGHGICASVSGCQTALDAGCTSAGCCVGDSTCWPSTDVSATYTSPPSAMCEWCEPAGHPCTTSWDCCNTDLSCTYNGSVGTCTQVHDGQICNPAKNGADCYNTRWKCVPDQATANVCKPEGPGDPCTYDADCGLADGNGDISSACAGSPGSKKCCVTSGSGCKDDTGTPHPSWCCSNNCNAGTCQ